MSLSGFFGFSQTTDGITVRVAPRFLAEQSDPGGGRWVWSYHVRIENGSAAEVQLLRRHWVITDGDGRISEVDGEGVVGEQPMIAPGGSFDYISGCPLPTPHGTMAGEYLMEAAGRCFAVTIPEFALSQPAAGAR
ncbi:Co2+/Mg2+ efflux protein ApaG [Polymorphobacter sp.]|uniref:Co2+/Mg2+ efflux protein ApaG n=1 Tax=Polymorphobacter sp. TaxID=1909290 RepID=UPI003F6F9AD6